LRKKVGSYPFAQVQLPKFLEIFPSNQIEKVKKIGFTHLDKKFWGVPPDFLYRVVPKQIGWGPFWNPAIASS